MGLALHIIIPTHRRKESLLHLLALLYNQEAGDVHYSICVILSAPEEETVRVVLAQFPDCHFVYGQEDWWWTVSINNGIIQAMQEKADAVLLLNDDIAIPKDYINILSNAAKKFPHAIIGSLNVTLEEEPKIFFSGAPSYNWKTGALARYHRFLSPVDGHLTGLHPSVVLPGRGLWIPISVFAEIGFFDQRELPHYKADYEFIYRAQKKGFQTLICWDAVVSNPAQETGRGATFVKQKPWDFFTAIFDEHSRSNLRQNTIYYLRLHPRWALPFFPFTALMILGRQFISFFTHKKYSSRNKNAPKTVVMGNSNI